MAFGLAAAFGIAAGARAGQTTPASMGTTSPVLTEERQIRPTVDAGSANATLEPTATKPASLDHRAHLLTSSGNNNLEPSYTESLLAFWDDVIPPEHQTNEFPAAKRESQIQTALTPANAQAGQPKNSGPPALIPLPTAWSSGMAGLLGLAAVAAIRRVYRQLA